MKNFNPKRHTLHKAGLIICGLLLAAGASATYPEGYYDSLEGKSGDDLIEAVKAVVRNHTVISYGAKTWEAFKYTDVETIDGVEYWWDMYSDNRLKVSDGRPAGTVMNIEHSVPNSWWGKTENDAYKDLVHLNPADATANSRKSNYPLAEVGSANWTNGYTTVGTPKANQGGGASNVFEPHDNYKGDFARAYMYIFTVYNDMSWSTSTNWMYVTTASGMFRSWARNLLLKWHRNDPVSMKENVRNEGIYTQQRNRNPFIDLPDLAEYIWGDKSGQAFTLDGSGDTPDTPGTGEEATSYTWLWETDADMGDWTIENIALPEGGSYVWNWKIYSEKGYLNGSAYIGGAKAAKAYAWSPVVNMAGVSKADFRFQHSAKYQTTLQSLCKLAVKDVDTDEVTTVEIPVWPPSGSWTWTDSSSVDLASFAGKKIRVGFLYESDTTGADTWEIRNASLSLVRDLSEVLELPQEEDDSFLVEVWGNNIAMPRGARVFDLNGREFDGKNMKPGIYIVTKPSFSKSVKVMIK